jgi:Cysteine-rich secretory protein family
MLSSHSKSPTSSSLSSSTSSTSSTHSSTSTVSSTSSSSSSKSSSTSSTTLSSSSSPSSSSTLSALPAATDYISTGLYYHNMHRRNHSAPMITWNPTQAAIAAEIASSCIFAHNMSVLGGGYGQNLAAYEYSSGASSLSPSLMLAKSITNLWYYGEVLSFLPSYYGQATPDMTNFGAWGHFSQVVWSGSLTVGCASQFCDVNTISPTYQSWFTVCNYVAPGGFPLLLHFSSCHATCEEHR